MESIGARVHNETYIMKQINDKPKVIWWAKVNVREPMIKDDFIRLQKHCLFGLEAQEG
jgi:hypothetical protein